MKLKPKSTIYLAIGKNISSCEVIGIYTHCTYLRSNNISWTLPEFENRGFYGRARRQNLVVLFLKKWWHYYPAMICEYFRNKITIKINLLCGLQQLHITMKKKLTK